MPSEDIEVPGYSVGSRKLTFATHMAQDKAMSMMMETERIFRFRFVSWNAESGKTEIQLVPDNGIRYLLSGEHRQEEQLNAQ